jgi:hypothetical protein
MPKDLDDHESPRKPLPRKALPRGPQHDTMPRLSPAIACAATAGLKPLPLKLSSQASIPTQIFGAETRAKRVRVLPPPHHPTPRVPSYGWIDALFGLFRR